MFYESPLKLLRNTFEKCRIQTKLIDPSASLDLKVDMGLMQLIGIEEKNEKSLNGILPELKSNTVYMITDRFDRGFIFLLLPDVSPETVLMIGPYLQKELTQIEILEKAEQIGVAPGKTTDLIKYYSNVPILTNDSPLLVLLDSFSELIWRGADNFTVSDINRELFDVALPNNPSETAEPENIEWRMQMMERRYAYENELMQAVINGQIHKTELLLSSFSSLTLERRLSDPVRNLKNYSIIMNTLLRKAAERGGVHPMYLDSTSSDFAARIEHVTTATALERLMLEMFRSYCQLVRRHSTKNYTPIVQKAIMIINADLTANLTLHALATALNINSSYLSNIFKKETGRTITEYVNEKRISSAKHLLKTTNLQIQTIAQYCGILDVHYFSRLFKKQCGMTPKAYREKKEMI